MELLHSPQEMRFLSDLAHWIEGGILGAVALAALAEAAGRLRASPGRYLWPSLILVAGLFLAPYLFLHHGLAQIDKTWRLVLQDMQQQQHLTMAALLLVAGAAELAARGGALRALAWRLAWPAALAAIGALFLIHLQHGAEAAVTWAQTVHRYLGIVLIAAALLRAAQVVGLRPARLFAYGWALALLAAALLLASYREPEGAYERMTFAGKPAGTRSSALRTVIGQSGHTMPETSSTATRGSAACAGAMSASNAISLSSRGITSSPRPIAPRCRAPA